MRKMNVRITPVGIVVIGILLAAVLVALFGPGPAQAPAFVVTVVVMAVVLGGSGYGGRGGQKSSQELKEEFGARPPRVDDDRADPQLEARAWQKERERYGR